MGRSHASDAGAVMRANVPVIALIGAVGIGVSFAVSPGLPGAFGAALALLMLAIAVSDAYRFIVPNELTALAFALALVSAGLFDAGPLIQALTACALRAVVTALPFLALMLLYRRLRGRPGLGLGDVKLAAVAGAWLDWFTIVGVVEFAALAALAAYGVWRFLLHRPIAATTPLPFGLFLAPAIWAGWVAEAVLYG
jgi:leader peptidase (prepilin peptidase) / N-methyltransferase